MKRFCAHVAVEHLAAGMRFWIAVSGIEPILQKSDHAKRQIDDPRVDCAILKAIARAASGWPPADAAVATKAKAQLLASAGCGG